MKDSKLEYFLNAIHYCLWLREMKSGSNARKIVNVLFAPIPKYLFTKAYRENIISVCQKNRKKWCPFSIIEKMDIISEGLIIGLVTFILLISFFFHSY